MTHGITRRNFMATTGTLAGIGLAGLSRSNLLAAELAKGAPNAEKLGWRLGFQAYTFHSFTFFETIDKLASVGLHYIEAYPSQKLSKAQPNIPVDEVMPAEARKTLNKKLADSGVKMVNYGVCGWSSRNPPEARKTFEFAKDMGIETIVVEAPEEAFEMLDDLCTEFEINVAIHNHPQPSHYWNPETVLKACKGRSKRIGACADTGHWVRSGLNPIECLKKLEGRIITFHFKDLNERGPNAHDVPWGTGVCDVKGMLAEIHRQRIKAVFSVEYEYNMQHCLPDIARSVVYFDKVAAELAGQG